MGESAKRFFGKLEMTKGLIEMAKGTVSRNDEERFILNRHTNPLTGLSI